MLGFELQGLTRCCRGLVAAIAAGRGEVWLFLGAPPGFSAGGPYGTALVQWGTRKRTMTEQKTLYLRWNFAPVWRKSFGSTKIIFAR